MELVIFTLFVCSFSECSSPTAKDSRRRRQEPGYRPGTTAKYVRRAASGAAGNGPCATINYLRLTRNGFSGNGVGTTIKFL
jgi:hypothetical protein